MLSVVTFKWQPAEGVSPFSALHVNVLRAALADKLKADHRMFCVTDDPAGIDGDITVVPLPERFAGTPRCRRRMHQYDREFAAQFGPRILSLDLDVVLVGDITPIVTRSEPVVLWKIDYAQAFSGSFVLMNAGALHGLWQRFSNDPEGYPVEAWPRGIGSDQAMLNHYLKGRPPALWTAKDGFVTFFGAGYERLEHWGVGPTRRALPAGARIVVLGSADLDALTDERYVWARDHWLSYARAIGWAAS